MTESLKTIMTHIMSLLMIDLLVYTRSGYHIQIKAPQNHRVELCMLIIFHSPANATFITIEV